MTIYGAGMSGLIAAIHLARRGHAVTVHDREKGFGGSRIFNPSLHVTPLDVQRTSEYIGIDLSGAFHQVIACPSYFNDLKVMFPVQSVYAVERGDRPTSLDTLLYGMCSDLGVEFAWESHLDEKVIEKLPPRTIIAGGLNPPTYDLLGIPYLKWEAWLSRGSIDMGAFAWLWWDRGINEYGYFTTANGIYFDMLFSIGRGVGRDCLRRYEEFMVRQEGIEHHDWSYVVGATPIARPDNPRLFWRDAVLAGTMTGSIDPMLGFGISGALVTGKVAAQAVYDRDGAVGGVQALQPLLQVQLLFQAPDMVETYTSPRGPDGEGHPPGRTGQHREDGQLGGGRLRPRGVGHTGVQLHELPLRGNDA